MTLVLDAIREILNEECKIYSVEDAVNAIANAVDYVMDLPHDNKDDWIGRLEDVAQDIEYAVGDGEDYVLFTYEGITIIQDLDPEAVDDFKTEGRIEAPYILMPTYEFNRMKDDILRALGMYFAIKQRDDRIKVLEEETLKLQEQIKQLKEDNRGDLGEKVVL